jgi:multidrug efflux pump subunit AcrA (membrane-fusion protein)
MVSSGRVAELAIKDNQLVHKGDLLMTIDPRDYQLAVDLANAAVDQATADYENKEAQRERRLKLTDLAASKEEQQTYTSAAEMARAEVAQQKANLERARINLGRTEIRAPVSGWVTNLLVRQGDYATISQRSPCVDDYRQLLSHQALRDIPRATDRFGAGRLSLSSLVLVSPARVVHDRTRKLVVALHGNDHSLRRSDKGGWQELLVNDRERILNQILQICEPARKSRIRCGKSTT